MFRKILIIVTLSGILPVACVGTSPTPGTPEPGAYPGPVTLAPPDSVVTSPPYPSPGHPSREPWEPAPGDDRLVRGEVFIDSREILVLESFPPQYVLYLKGSAPTPCHQLRVRVTEPDNQNRIQVEVYSLVEPGKVCIQVLEPFEARISLGSYASGQYPVWVNDELVGEIKPQ